MDKKESKETTDVSQSSVSYSSLLKIFISFILGIICALFIFNSSNNEVINFSTPELVGFLFSIAIASASIILAIVAINLGRSSERAMIERSDESIRLQNEVFTKTTEALKRIESSTGVTEKRIEDIISGRVGDISHRIAEITSDSSFSKGKKSRDSLEEEIRNSIMEEFNEERRTERENKRKEQIEKRKEATKKYEEYINNILLSISNLNITKSEKIGDGSYEGVGEELFDGVFEIKGEKIGISAFSNNEELLRARILKDGFQDYLVNISNELKKKNFDKVILAFDSQFEEGNPFKNRLENLSSIIDKSIFEKIQVFFGDPEKVTQKIVDEIKEAEVL